MPLIAFKGLEMLLLSCSDPSEKEWISPVRLRPLKIKIKVCPHHFRTAILPENKLTCCIFSVAPFVSDLILWVAVNFVLLTTILSFLSMSYLLLTL